MTLAAPHTSMESMSKTDDTKLKAALEAYDWDSAIEALERGANPNVRAKSGLTALSMACWYSKVEVARKLLERGARPTLRM